VRQTWASVAFVHWRFDATSLRPLIPHGTDVAERDGSAWVSLVLFCANDTRGPLPWGPSLPPFGETNLRTYLRLADGREAIWFLSIEASSALTSFGGRVGYGAPYHRADTTVTGAEGGDGWRYRSRRPATGIGHDLTVIPASRGPAPGVDDWLTGRWRALTVNRGVLLEAMVEHEPWSLRPAVVGAIEEDLLATVGLARPPEATLAHLGDDVHVRLGPPVPARATPRR
jgi:hypothetical protein